MHDKIIEEAEELRSEIDRHHEALEHEIENNRINHRLGPEHDAAAIANHRNRLGNCFGRVDELVARAVPVLESLQPAGEPRAVTDPVRLHLIQADLLRLPVDKRRSAFFAAINAGDAAVYHAVINAPSTLGLLPSDDVSMGKDRWSQKYSPHSSAPHAEMIDALNRLHAAANRERAIIRICN